MVTRAEVMAEISRRQGGAQAVQPKAESFLGKLPLNPLNALGSPQEIGRQLLRTGRAAGAGIAGLGDIINAPIDAVLGMAGSDFRFGSPSQTVRQGFDTATQGTAFSTAPQNATERVVDTASEFVAGASPFKLAQAAIAAPQAAQGLARLAPQTAQELTSLAGAGTGAGVAKEVAPDSAIAPLVGALAGGSATQMALNAPAATERGVRNIALGANARSGEDLAAQALQGKQAAGSIRNEITKMGVVVKPEKARDIVSNIDDALKEVDLIPELSPKTFNVVKRIRDLVDKGEGISLNYLDQYRRTLRSAVGEDSVAAGAVRRALDGAVNNAQEGDFIGRNGKVAVDLLNRFRKEYTQASKFDDIADIIVRAQGDGNFIKRELTKFMNKKENTMGFSKVEKAALSRAANLGNTMALGKILGKFGFDTNRLGSGVGGIFGSTTGGVIGLGAAGAGGAATGAAVVPAVGTAAKYGYNLATRGQAENLLRTIEGTAPKQLIPEVGNISRTTRTLQSAAPAMAQGLNAEQPAPVAPQITREQIIQEIERRKTQAVQTPPVTLPNATQPSTMDVVPFEQLMPEAQPNTGTVQPLTPEPFNPSPQSSIEGVIGEAAQIGGANPDLLMAIAETESSLNPNAQAKTSSATGLFQITKDTWRNLVDKYGEQYGVSMRDIRDPRANAIMASLLTRENGAKVSRALGRQITDGEKYIAHFMGAGGAVRLLQADPEKAAYKLFPKEAKANKSIFFAGKTPRTTQEVAQLLASKVEDKMQQRQLQEPPIPQPQPTPQPAPLPEDTMLANIPLGAIQELRKNPDNAAQFDEVFGNGMAQLALR